MLPTIEFEVIQGDALHTGSDLFLAKYAQERYGVDGDLVAALNRHGQLPRDRRIKPRVGQVEFLETDNKLPFAHALFVGTPPLIDLDYPQLVAFARRGIHAIRERELPVRHLTTTIHGKGYGLDPRAAFQSLMEGFLMAPADTTVRRITFVERDERTVRLLREHLQSDEFRASVGQNESAQAPPEDQYAHGTQFAVPESVGARTSQSAPGRELIFVAMPFAEEFEDVYQFGIYGPVKKHGYLCEQVGQAAFTGDVLHRIRQKIEAATLVIADLTLGRPNVYLEVGYAWGCGVPVLIVARQGEELHFDVQTHRCIIYKNISHLSREIYRFLEVMKSSDSD